MRPVLAALAGGRGTLASAGLLSRLLCLLLNRLHSLQGSFDGNQAFAQNADSVEKTIEAVFVNRGWFRHNACHRINPEEGKSARWRKNRWIRRQWSGRSREGISPWRDHMSRAQVSQCSADKVRECLTTVAYKPSIVIEQATSSYSFRSSELSQPI